jgi:hypothetical protein
LRQRVVSLGFPFVRKADARPDLPGVSRRRFLAYCGTLTAVLALGVALVSSLKQQGITDTDVPVSNLVIFLVLAALLGLIAASWPARRAARLDVLAAIAAQLCAHRAISAISVTGATNAR